MKLELKRESDFTGDWYFVMVDGMCRKATQDLKVAEFVYDNIKNGTKETEVIKSEEV